MKVINLFAEPSAGKSTTAAGLFFLMKHKGYNVELVSEYAKDCVWENRKDTLNDQLYITGKQNHKLEVLRGKVDFVIVDSPLILGILYSRGSSKFPSYFKLVKEVFDSYQNINILLKRVKPYKQVGRIQNEDQAKAVRVELIKILNELGINYQEMDGNNSAPEKIFSFLFPY